MTATGTKTSYPFQSSFTCNKPSLSNNLKEMDISNDIHLKMSKKIAQLTKVIYTLNTKNDEHDIILSTIKNQHKEEIQKLLEDTKNKIDFYHKQALEVDKFKKHIKNLEKVVEEQSLSHNLYLTQFKSYKNETEEKEIQLRKTHAEEILNCSNELLNLKKQFESRLLLIDDIKQHSETEKNTLINELKETHRKEINQLRNEFATKIKETEFGTSEIENKYQDHIKNLTFKISEAEVEKIKICQDYENKLEKAQNFYEKELEAISLSQNSKHDDIVKNLIKDKERLQADLNLQNSNFSKELEIVKKRLLEKEEIITNSQDQITEFKSQLNSEQNKTNSLNNKLELSQNEINLLTTDLNFKSSELASVKTDLKQKTNEILQKSALLGELEASRLEQDCVSKDLQLQLDRLRHQLLLVEQAKLALETNSQNSEQENSICLHNLQQSLEEANLANQQLREKFESDILVLNETFSQQQKETAKSHEKLINKIKNEHISELESLRLEQNEILKKLNQDNDRKTDEIKSQLNNQLNSLQRKYHDLESEGNNKVTVADEEIKLLRNEVSIKDKEVKSLESNITDYKARIDTLEQDLLKRKTDHSSSSKFCESLKKELHSIKLIHSKQLDEKDHHLKSELEELKNKLDTEWNSTLKEETTRIRKEIHEHLADEKSKAIMQLNKQKEEEFLAAKAGWEKKISDLLKELSFLKNESQVKDQKLHSQIEELSNIIKHETDKHKTNSALMFKNHQQQIEELKSSQEKAFSSFRESKNKEFSEREENLIRKHSEELHSQILAHNALTEMMKQKNDNEMEELKNDYKIKLEKQIHSLNTELQHRHANELDDINRLHQEQLLAAKEELQQALEITKRRDGENAILLAELQEEISAHESSIKKLKEESIVASSDLNNLQNELKLKGKDLIRVQSESENKLKLYRKEITEEYQQKIFKLQADHVEKTEGLLGEFNQAQELLKDKISALQQMLDEAEERYRNRESREEDLLSIHQLREAVLEREEMLNKLENDKKYFQMELVNRETNFNKVFNASPNVGFLNPLVKRTKSDKSGIKNVAPAAFNSTSKLEPLPGSPLHDEKLNLFQRLPPMTKKFVR